MLQSANGNEAWELVEAIQQLSLAKTPDEVQAIVRSAARRLCGADGATVVIRAGDNCRYVDEDAIAPLWKGKEFPLSTCISGWVMINKLPAAIEDIYLDDRIPHDAYRPTFVKSLAMVPIRREDPIGAIGNYWAQPHAPTAHEVGLLQALADSTAVAMQNVGVWSELEDRVAERTGELERALMVHERLIGTLAHELRNTVCVSEGLLGVVLRTDELGDHARELIDHAHRAATEASRIVEDQLTASQDRAGELLPRYSELEIAPFLEELRSVYAALSQPGDVAVEVEAGTHPPTIHTDRGLLLQALRNLILNALKFTIEGRITVRADAAEPGWVAFSVSDSGPGIPEDERARIFEDWTRGDYSAAADGSGLGLPFVTRVAEVLGGRVELDSTMAVGSTFTITVPDRARAETATTAGSAPSRPRTPRP